VVENLLESLSFPSKREVPFGFAQGRLSTAFGFRLTSLRMTMLTG
jgi:hypothetical protein